MAVRTEGDTGIRVPVSPPSPETGHVLTDVVLRRHQQINQYGHNETTPDGTGPDVQWAAALAPGTLEEGRAAVLEMAIREDYDQHVRSGQPLTWMHLLREEFAEAMAEDDPAKLYDELIDVIAVGVSWCEKIRQR